jgi:phospholipid-binding lipoprotein MlaA
LALGLGAGLGAGFSGQALAQAPDPYEKLNRKAFAVNDFFDRILLKPVARGYTKVVPRFARRGIHNAFVNLGTPSVALNQLLQGKGVKAASDSGRFLVNTTLGLGGLFDPATQMGLVAHNEDFGQTLQVWGVGTGPHIVMPLTGSTTVTDAVGSFVGAFTNPLLLLNDTQSQIIVRVLGVVDLRAELLSAETLVSGDRYLFLRDAILQRREFLVNDGQIDDDPFLSDEEFDDEDEDWDDEI